jgi:polyphenol oxidase
MDQIICPDIFNGHAKAFFTVKSLGADIDRISSVMSIKKDRIFLPLQKHTDKVLVLDAEKGSGECDAVVTRKTGILIGVRVADCVPVLLCDKRRSTVGVVHAGWRGTAAQIIKKTIYVMAEKFGSCHEDILIALGPSIKRDCYGVGAEVEEAVRKATGEGDYWVRSCGQSYVDLPSANAQQALSTGVPPENIWISGECTYCNPEKYHSYRYHKDYNGGQGGFIGIF